MVAGILSFLALARHRAVLAESRQLSLQRVDRILERYQELLLRHPNLDLRDAVMFWEDFRTLKHTEAVDRVEELLDTYRVLRYEMQVALLGPDDIKAQFKTFTPAGFKQFYDALIPPHSAAITASPAITGDIAADTHIQQLAEERGYRLRYAAETTRLISYRGHRLQPEVLESWKHLQRAALLDGIEFGLISAYRSIDRQRQIFMGVFEEMSRRFSGRRLSFEEIADGGADTVLQKVLKESSIPGYSKHHSGYTLDIVDLSSRKDFTEFGNTPGYLWMSADNFYNAKRFGFIPSYPAGVGHQGPDPEPWEFVWVGEPLLKEELNL